MLLFVKSLLAPVSVAVAFVTGIFGAAACRPSAAGPKAAAAWAVALVARLRGAIAGAGGTLAWGAGAAALPWCAAWALALAIGWARAAIGWALVVAAAAARGRAPVLRGGTRRAAGR